MSDIWKNLALPVLLAFDYAFLCYYAWRSWHAFSAARRGRHFYFRITDIWAAMIGLTPSLVLAGQIANHRSPEWHVVALLMLVPAQVLWMFKGRLLAQEAERVTGGHNPLESATMILGGAVWAIPFAVLCAVALTTCLPAFVLYAVLYVRREAREDMAG